MTPSRHTVTLTAPNAWRLLLPEEAPEAYRLHRAVLANTPAGMVRPDAADHFAALARIHGRILGCYADAELVAYGVLAMDSPTVDHLATLLDAGDGARARLCVLDGAATLPQWRGRKLHGAVIRERMALGRSLGRTLVAATVAPENMRSLRGLLEQGFTVRRYAVLYGGLPRLVMQNDLLRGTPAWRRLHWVASDNHTGHRLALAEGLTGYACWQDEDRRWFVDYGLP